MSGTGLMEPESGSEPRGFRSVEPKREIAGRLQSEHKYHAAKTFCYFAVHDTFVGFGPTTPDGGLLPPFRGPPARGSGLGRRRRRAAGPFPATPGDTLSGYRPDPCKNIL